MSKNEDIKEYLYCLGIPNMIVENPESNGDYGSDYFHVFKREDIKELSELFLLMKRLSWNEYTELLSDVIFYIESSYGEKELMEFKKLGENDE